MARILSPNKDGTSDAQVGDIVVTGGGIYEKTANGSVRRTDLESQSGYSGGVGDYQKLTTTVYNSVKNALSGNSSGGGGGSTIINKTGTPDYDPHVGPAPGEAGTSGATDPTPQTSESWNITYDVNGIGSLDDFGFNPNNYATPGAGSTGDGEAVKTFFGYVLLAITALVVVDRLMK